MRKERKCRDFYTIDKKIYDLFIKHVEDNNINKSKLIESLIENYIKNISNDK